MSLSYNERMKISFKVSNKTKKEAIKLLRDNGRCLIVRPTGFGKTYLLCKIAEEVYLKTGKPIIYIYPNDIIVNEIMSNDEYINVRDKFVFYSYQKLAQNFSDSGKGSSREEILGVVKSSSIILIDEVHRSAALGFRDFYDSIKDFISKDGLHILGVTATIDRVKDEETLWIKQELFRGIEVFDYSLGDAMKDGVLLPPTIIRPMFNFDKEIETIRGDIKKIHQQSRCYNESDLDQQLDKMKIDWGNNGEDIYKAVKSVGYNLASSSPDDSYLKFIVFFKNTEHLLEEGENIENYFRLATNSVASSHLGKKVSTSMEVEYVISDTADGQHDYVIRDFCEKKDYRIYRNKPVDVGTVVKLDDNGKTVVEYKKPKANHIDLIFNIGTIVMGYHVPYTSGVMLLRNTSTSILFYQQIGRCFSIRSNRNPIIFDVVSNTSKDFSTNEGITFRGMMRGFLSERERNTSDGEEIINAVQVGLDSSATEDWLGRINAIRDKDFTYIDRIKYLYSDRKMPISFIANDLDISCEKVMKVLIKSGLKIEDESSEYKLLLDEIDSDNSVKDYNYKHMKFLCSKESSVTWKRIFGGRRVSLFDKFVELIGRLGL